MDKMLNFNTKESSFLTAGIISLLVYLLIVFLFFLYLKTSDIKKFDPFKNDTILELNILIDENSVIKNKKSEIKESKKSEEIVEKSKSISSKHQASVKSLFANVEDKAEKTVNEEVKNIVESNVTSRFKAKFEKQRKTEKLSVSSILDDIKSKASVMPSSQSNNETDPYYSKIYELLAQRWNPMLIVDGLYAKVLVIITNDGKFDYKFLRYSGNESFDNSLNSFLNEQVNITYPKHDKGPVTKIEVLFKAKG